MATKKVTDASFKSDVLDADKPVLVDFWADWCEPCKTLMPILAKLADEYQGAFILAKIDTEAEQEIAAQLGIRSLPTVKLIITAVLSMSFPVHYPNLKYGLFSISTSRRVHLLQSRRPQPVRLNWQNSYNKMVIQIRPWLCCAPPRPKPRKMEM